MSLAASGAEPGCALLMYRRLNLRTTNHRTYLLKVGQPDPLKVIILHTGWKPTRGFLSFGRSTLALVELCLRRDEAHAIVQFLLTSDPVTLVVSHHMTSLHKKLQHFASISTFSDYHPSILSRLCHFEILLTLFPFHTHSHPMYFQLPVVTRSTGIMAWSAVYA